MTYFETQEGGDVMSSEKGVVVIGRNEGLRLQACLRSCVAQVRQVVYVDSGSTDNSLEIARSLGVTILELDMQRPFTAGRARNEGFKALIEKFSDIEFVQFVDGDCEIVDGWFESAIEVLSQEDDISIVCGRLTERYPEASLYNKICDLEWNRAPGVVNACGGIFMIRAQLFERIGGFNNSLIAGEEPEMCLRIRRIDGKIYRSATNMALHDAAMTRFSQWWRRCERGGFAYAQGMVMYGRETERYCVKETMRIWFWGLLFPIAVLLGVLLMGSWALLLLLVYIRQFISVVAGAKQLNSLRDRYLFGVVCVVVKFPELMGQFRFFSNLLRGRPTRIIEYK